MLQKLVSEIELMGRHLEVIQAVIAHQPIGIMKLSEVLQIPYHRIRYSLRVLEQDGYIQASPAGAVATPRAENLMNDLDGTLTELILMLESMKREKTSNL